MIEKRREFFGHCDMNNARRILSQGSTLSESLMVLLDLVEKASFSKEFRSEFHSRGGGNK